MAIRVVPQIYFVPESNLGDFFYFEINILHIQKGKAAMKNASNTPNFSSKNHYSPITQERRDRIMNRIEAILNRGNNVEIKRRSNGIIAVMEIKVTKYEE